MDEEEMVMATKEKERLMMRMEKEEMKEAVTRKMKEFVVA